MELGRLADAVRRDLGDRVADLAGGAFTSWEAALRFFAALAATEPLAVVLDEAPYLARSTPDFPSIVQAVWDHLPRRTKLLLVLTGSAVGTIEAMLGPAGALRGRPADTIRMDPLDPWQARGFLPRLDPVRFFETYAACGGYPLHLAAWDPTASTDANLGRLAGTAGGILLDDAPGILGEELPEHGGYAWILAAIGRGRTRYAEIAGEAGQRVEHPLDVLVRGGFVAKAVPVGAPRGARGIYALADAYLAFWFRVLYSDLALIDGGQGTAVLRRARPRWQTHLGAAFEEVARAHARRLVARGEFPEDLVIGRWWAASGPACEVDVLGLRGPRTALLGEARWQADPLGLPALEQLRRKAARVPSRSRRPSTRSGAARGRVRMCAAPAPGRSISTRWCAPEPARQLLGSWPTCCRRADGPLAHPGSPRGHRERPGEPVGEHERLGRSRLRAADASPRRRRSQRP